MRPAKTSIVHFLSRIGVSVVGFIGTLYLSRILGAEVYGVFVVVLSLAHWLNIPSAALSTAVTQRVSGTEGKQQFLGAGFLLNFGIIAVLVAALILFDDYLTQYIGAPVTLFLVFIASGNLVFTLVTAGLEGQKKVGLSGILIFLERVFRVGTQVALLLAGFQLVGALIGYGLGFLVTSVIGLALYDVGFSLPGRHHFRSLISYASYSWLGSIKAKVSGPSVDALILNFFVASSFIGIYHVTWNVASILVMVSGSIQTTLFPEISELAAENEYDRVRVLLEEGLVFAGIFAIPGLFGAALIGPRVLRIYGSEFQAGGIILLLLIVARTVSSYGSQFNSALNAVNRPELAFRVNLVLIISNVVLNLILIPFIGWYGAALATAGSGFLMLTLAYYYLTYLIGRVELPLKEFGKQTIASIMMTAVILGLLPFVPRFNNYATVAIVMAGAAVYGVVLYLLSSYVREKVKTLSPLYIRR